MLVRYESQYAGNMAAGKWRPRKNKVLVSHVLGALGVRLAADQGHGWPIRMDFPRDRVGIGLGASCALTLQQVGA